MVDVIIQAYFVVMLAIMLFVFFFAGLRALEYLKSGNGIFKGFKR